VYDIGADTGWVSAGQDGDTAAFAVQTIRRWWHTVGTRAYPEATKPPLSRWNKHPPGKPVTTLRVTKITTAIRRDHQPPATRRRQSLTQTAGP